MKSIALALPLVLAACALSAVPVMADVMIVQSTVINAPGVRSMLEEIPESQRAVLDKAVSPIIMGTPWVTTTYMHGDKMRTDMGQTSVIINTASAHTATINRQAQTYAIGPYDPFQKAAGDVTCEIRPTGQTTNILGYRADGYAITLHLSVLPNSPVTGMIWATQELPAPPPTGFTGPVSKRFEEEFAKVKGMPLSYKIGFENTAAGNIDIESNAVSISDAPLSAEVFEIPSSFHEGKVQTATAMPTAGIPLGDGMPLDTVGAIGSDVASDPGGAGAGSGISDQALQQLLGQLGGGSGSAGSGVSAQQLNQLLSQMGGSGGGSGSGSGLGNVNIGQLSQMMNSLLNGDDSD